ncbi:OTU domain-containing protein 6B-like isoform X2 [Orbicella faveolata]|uniref:OTU domain-containing protein 6B-like isoform X2 n=1 Tax=Orbicella faveolata TaxID=48498 RepID=UPI0009E4EC28|nr:OTU domain-containing protein 6B-like isoform X2 [Orbicella faveolata]
MADEEGESSLELAFQRHKKEAKELQAKIQSLKHSVPKGDKKKKKEVALEIAKLEEELTNRQKKELEVLKNDLTRENSQGQDVTKEIEAMSLNADNSESQSKLSKAQKRRDKKAAKEREREERIAEAELENVHSARNVEAEKLKEILASKCLSIKEISPDGNCLYNAVADQLSRRNQQTEMQTLRKLAADYILNHQDDFLPFLTDAKTDQFVQYCEEIASTTTWGGHLEIQALSQALKMPIEVYQAHAPVLRIGEEYESQPISLSYHHHAYGLGEHYNSVIPAEECFES